MKNIELYIPKLEDYWFEEKIQNDVETMSYNAGYNVSYFGYHYDTGCIEFPKEKWQEEHERRIREKRFMAYIKDIDLNEFVGYVNYYYNKMEERYCCGVLIESKYRGKGYSKQALKLLCEVAKKNQIKELYDSFEVDRSNTLEIFKSCGFKVQKYLSWKKFGKNAEGVLVKIEL